jgi:hypothetical protein
MVTVEGEHSGWPYEVSVTMTSVEVDVSVTIGVLTL